jgi:hypothetical protein
MIWKSANYRLSLVDESSVIWVCRESFVAQRQQTKPEREYRDYRKESGLRRRSLQRR